MVRKGSEGCHVLQEIPLACAPWPGENQSCIAKQMNFERKSSARVCYLQVQCAKLRNHVQDQPISLKQSLYPGSVTSAFAVSATGLYPGGNGQGDDMLLFFFQVMYREARTTEKIFSF